MPGRRAKAGIGGPGGRAEKAGAGGPGDRPANAGAGGPGGRAAVFVWIGGGSLAGTDGGSFGWPPKNDPWITLAGIVWILLIPLPPDGRTAAGYTLLYSIISLVSAGTLTEGRRDKSGVT
jgi:hypothetical protein